MISPFCLGIECHDDEWQSTPRLLSFQHGDCHTGRLFAVPSPISHHFGCAMISLAVSPCPVGMTILAILFAKSHYYCCTVSGARADFMRYIRAFLGDAVYDRVRRFGRRFR